MVQRVHRARVTVETRTIGQILGGVLILLGVGRSDSPESAAYCADKIANLRIFPDSTGKMNLSLLESGGAALVVSQFTLYGDTLYGRRPSFSEAALPEEAKVLYEEFIRVLRLSGVPVESGMFQAHMDVELINDGPVTILLDSEKLI